MPLVNAKDGDNGIMYYGRESDFDSVEMAIDIVNDGAVSTGNVYPQPQKTGVLYNAYLIAPNFTVTSRQLFFLSSVIKKSIKRKFGYDHKASWDRVKKEVIMLPRNIYGQIDFDFMEQFINELEEERISELEEERISELEAYLQVTSLKDYILTDEERKALDEYTSLHWKLFNIEKLFGKSTRGRRLKSDDRIPGILPFVTAGEADEGISDFIGNNVVIFNENTTTIDMFGSAKYRNYKYGGDDHIAVVHTETLDKYASIFVTSAIHKASHNGQFSYDKNFYAKDADVLNIMLPEKNGIPDYDYMKILISAIHKIIIENVVEYADRKIAATKILIR